MDRVAAVVVTWDSAAHVGRCLAALDALEHDPLELVVVDNASTDRTLVIIDDFMSAGPRHPVTVHRLTQNAGFSGGVNIAVRASDAEAVLLVNPDATIEPDALTRMLTVLERHPECGSVQPRVRRLRPDGSGADTDGHGVPLLDTTGHVLTRPRLVLNRHAGEPDDGRAAAAGEVFGVSGAVALHRRSMLEDVARGPQERREHLTEDLVAYFDDVELDLRARMRGWTARYEPSALAHHARAGASARRRRRVRVLNLANHPLVILGTEGWRTLARDAVVIVPLWLVRLLAAALRSPLAVLLAVARMRALPAALRRGRVDRARARVPLDEVLDRWIEPLPPGWMAAASRRAMR